MGSCLSSPSNKLELSIENVNKLKTIYTLENINKKELKTIENSNKSQTLHKTNKYNNNDNYLDVQHNHHCNNNDDHCGSGGGSGGS
jgi:hypothetical protein